MKKSRFLAIPRPGDVGRIKKSSFFLAFLQEQIPSATAGRRPGEASGTQNQRFARNGRSTASFQ
jgi:hypothetical protein